MRRDGTVFKGALLIAGTTIGGGMLAMPVLTSLGGFIPSMVVFFVSWLFMATTGLLLLEVCLWMEGDTNFISMTHKTLGRWGEIFSWVVYLFFFYCLTLAYVVACGKLVGDLFQPYLPEWTGPVIFLALFGPLVFVGARLVGRVNIFLMAGLIISFFFFLVLGYSYVNSENLLDKNWLLSLKTLPIAFAAFGFQGTVPTLTRYLDYDKRKVQKAILIGSFAAFITYVIWHWLILGIVPKEGVGGLAEALIKGDTAVQPLKYILNDPVIYIVSEFFAFFALVTSFLGVTLGLRDFLADGLGVKKTAKGRVFLCSLIFVPVLIAALLYPGIFIEALGYAGGYGGALLLGLLPILMVWSGRHYMDLPDKQVAPLGRGVLSLMILFVVFEIIVETLHVLKIF
ncbi:MAG: Tyrosine-specific transport protein [Chlamydiae bacterium]|nr:Tyrosine-specific transport protein [Chlamydiota bacterium]